MSSLKLTQKLSQRMVLTPQLRQRIELLQMTTVELSDLIQQEIVSNPILEEVQSEDEIGEIADKILDQNSDGHNDTYENGHEKDFEAANFEQAENFTPEMPTENGSNENESRDFDNETEDFSAEKSDSFEEVDYGREFQDYLDPGYKTQELEFKEDAPSFDQFLSKSATLTEHLEWQLNMQQISEHLENVAVCVVGNLNDDGRLMTSNASWLERLKRVSQGFGLVVKRHVQLSSHLGN